MINKKRNAVSDADESYSRWREGRDRWLADPVNRQAYDEEAARSELWLQLVEARQAASLTQGDVARRLGISRARVASIEKRGYESCSLNTLRRYVQALGGEYQLTVEVRRSSDGARNVAVR